MRTLDVRHCHALALSLIAACGGGGNSSPDAKIVIPDSPVDTFVPDAPPDAQQFDFSCKNNPPPITAPATVTISGSANDINLQLMQEPVVGAAVIGHKLNGQMVGAPTASDTNGAWTLALPTQNVPIDGYIEGTANGKHTMRVYPPQPLVADQAGIPMLLLNPTIYAGLAQQAGVNQDAANGVVALLVFDCGGTTVGGATISATQQGGTEVGEKKDISALMPGVYAVFNVPPGDTVINATAGGMAFRAHTVGVVAGTISSTIVTPGFAN